jgi:6-phosphogluconolactonase
MDAAGTEVRVFEDLVSVSEALARALVESARVAIAERGRFTMALAGGNTPRTLYRILAEKHRDDVSWSQVHFFWSDERFVDAKDPESNVGLALALLAPLHVPESNLHAPDTRLASPEETARRYEDELEPFLPLDAVLLGLGEDGHIASLFPDSPALDETKRLILAVRNAPKPPPLRVTMSLPAVNRAREVHFLVSGTPKRDALARTLSGKGSALPARRVHPEGGTVTWWVDRLALP